jgi:hypothetical protein
VPDANAHPAAAFVLDVLDKAIKASAVFLGGLWTWWNYRKSRTYKLKLELDIAGTVFLRGDLFGDVEAIVRNIGGAIHPIQQIGTFCELLTVQRDLTEHSIDVFPVFLLSEKIEPNQAIRETLFWRIPQPIEDIVWIKLVLRVVSDGVEWNTSRLIRVDPTEMMDFEDER